MIKFEIGKVDSGGGRRFHWRLILSGYIYHVQAISIIYDIYILHLHSRVFIYNLRCKRLKPTLLVCLVKVGSVMLSILLFYMVMVQHALVLSSVLLLYMPLFLHCIVACCATCYFYVIMLKLHNCELEAVCSLTLHNDFWYSLMWK